MVQTELFNPEFTYSIRDKSGLSLRAIPCRLALGHTKQIVKEKQIVVDGPTIKDMVNDHIKYNALRCKNSMLVIESKKLEKRIAFLERERREQQAKIDKLKTTIIAVVDDL